MNLNKYIDKLKDYSYLFFLIFGKLEKLKIHNEDRFLYRINL